MRMFAVEAKAHQTLYVPVGAIQLQICHSALFQGRLACVGVPLGPEEVCEAPDRPPAMLERHDEPKHGDVCRDDETGFFCPSGCFQTSTAPFCVQKKLGQPSGPCRVSGLRDTRVHNTHQNRSTGDGGPCDVPNNPKGKEERYSMHENHGDVCRDELGNFFCPRGCNQVVGRAPYCLSNTPGEEDMPCRLSGPAKTLSVSSARAALGIDAELQTAKSCDKSLDPQRELGAVLERHTDPDHGDICRKPDWAFFCPSTCKRKSIPPYCYSSTSGTGKTDMPCREPIQGVSKTQRLAKRLTELEQAKQRYLAMKDTRGVKRIDGNIHLVKFDLRQAKQNDKKVAMKRRESTLAAAA
eukprot:CAMPEP_0172632170 /NCGR_PEP_ID=MMETSP1068-20121228/183074_1 /TAXON_ID=35684 /ORGANISM="Pseudopedinella elastica, Strain CCMP716" /LENGTH=352 /DNA_ID=CAMNT_0013443495 /DNA_START=144 /DNA_END=1201 /DNA_ORIENTATION=+